MVITTESEKHTFYTKSHAKELGSAPHTHTLSQERLRHGVLQGVAGCQHFLLLTAFACCPTQARKDSPPDLRAL